MLEGKIKVSLVRKSAHSCKVCVSLAGGEEYAASSCGYLYDLTLADPLEKNILGAVEGDVCEEGFSEGGSLEKHFVIRCLLVMFILYRTLSYCQ